MTQSTVNQAGDEVDIRSTLDMLVEQKRAIIWTTVTFLLLGVLYLLAAPPVFQANITVQVEDSSNDMASSMGSVIGGLSSLFSVKSTDDGEMEILHSRLVTTSAVEAERMFIEAQPKRFPLVGNALARHAKGLSTPGILGVGGYAWGKERIDIAQFDVPKAKVDDKYVVTAVGDDRYQLSGDDLAQPVDGRVGVLLIANTEEGPVSLKVASLAAMAGAKFEIRRRSQNDVVEELQKKLVVTELGKDQSGVIGVKLKDADPVRAAAILNVIADRYVAQNRERKAETADQSLRFLQGQLPSVHRQLQDEEDRLTAYQQRRKVVSLSDQSKALLGHYVDASTALLQLQQKRRELLAALSERHPQVLALDRQIEAAKSDVSDVEGTLGQLPADQQGMVRLTRDVQVQTQLYIGLLNSIQQLQLARAGGVGNVRVIDHAVVPDKPLWPKPMVILAASFGGGLFLGVLGCFTRAALTGVVIDPHDVERQTLTDVTAVIPASAGQRRIARHRRKGGLGPFVLATRVPRDPAVEAIRLLRTSLQFSKGANSGSHIALVTGATEGVGKSFTATNLAVLLGRAGKRVLLVDADLRRGRLHRDFGRQAGPGLAELLLGSGTAEHLILREVTAHVDLLRAGSAQEPDELFEQSDVRDALRTLADSYDFVIVDSPPVLGIADTELLRPAADIVLLVVRSGRTTTAEIVETAKRLQRAGSGPVDVVFNGFTPGLRSRQYGYYGYAADQGREGADNAPDANTRKKDQ
ncbi:polysaccharide biosynthesis tyrosine autokinase [Paraburkholderia sabiae]|uniref:non-specific protein-tyrosine kinase n=1 Tax=Paraburkholderia sabiae TaxID=273251 RepID=A0ABU9QSX7_9BURK|nr:polysaccharide biosynthesis tyrosine autokinase [Paraburkholderia sabiae]WJZ79605.1 polysaccharide biosynthesis tyrosine autokinase [Paraburkholderia sabiae]CAD6563100.1 Tyrosine-protein kinase etk [Paraburkholderia sabiae]